VVLVLAVSGCGGNSDEAGAARLFFYRGRRGRYADQLLEAARRAREAGLGLWLACQPEG
jgi:endonuclease YncB( thermonuclease family)